MHCHAAWKSLKCQDKLWLTSRDTRVHYYQPGGGQRSKGLHWLDLDRPTNWQLDLRTIKDILLASWEISDSYNQRMMSVYHDVAMMKITKMCLPAITVNICEFCLHAILHYGVKLCATFTREVEILWGKCCCVYRGIFLLCHVYTWKEKLMLNTDFYC